MTTFDDLPRCAVNLIKRCARTRRIPGTNRFAQVCRSWRDADGDDQEQLQLLLALEGLPPDTVMFTSQWLAQHGACVTSLHITYDPSTAPLFQQLPLSTAPLAGLARLEVDGPDSLLALAPALPQLVALTHLKASISLVCAEDSDRGATALFSVNGAALQSVPSLEQLCPGLRSVHMTLELPVRAWLPQMVDTRLSQLFPSSLDQLHLTGKSSLASMIMPCASLARLTSLRRLTLDGMSVQDPDLLLQLPALEDLELHYCCWAEGVTSPTLQGWAVEVLHSAPQHMTKIAGLQLSGHGVEDALPELLVAAPRLCKVYMTLSRDEDAARVQQLGALSGLRQLDLFLNSPPMGHPLEAATGLSFLPSFQQLTYLHVAAPAAVVPRSTWAGLLPRLPQLRVLAVGEVLLEGLAPEVTQLSQLQCLYVRCSRRGCELGAGYRWHTDDTPPAVAGSVQQFEGRAVLAMGLA
jgi:hypothetical protein